MKVRWSKEEIEYMKKYFSSAIPSEAERVLGRKWGAIYQYGNRVLGIKRDTNTTNHLRSKANIGKAKKYSINSKYFSAINKDNAYVLGLMLTDGCISKRKNRDYYILSLGLKYNDKYILDKINSKMQSNYRIYKNGCMSRLVIRDQEICRDLMRMNMVLRKSKVLMCPEIPDDCIGDFLRGVIDGDGTVQVNKPRTTIFTASKQFSYDLVFLYGKIGIEAKTYNITRNGSEMYHVVVSGIEKNMKLFNTIYLAADLFLERKRDRFRQIYDKYTWKYK